MLSFLADSSLLTEESLVIVEAAKETEFDYLDEIGLTLQKRKEYKAQLSGGEPPAGEACTGLSG